MSDDCTVKHPPLTGLDHASMAAAFEASHIGVKGRKPTWVRGAGTDDGEYWISVSDHYGMFSDGICRAGWSRYWEIKLGGGDSADPKLGDLPALFQPDAPAAPHPTPGTLSPTPVVAPSVEEHPQMRVLTEDELNRSLAPIAAALVTLQAAVDELRARKPEAIVFPDYDLRLPFGSRGTATKKVQ